MHCARTLLAIAEEVISSSGEPQCVFMVWSKIGYNIIQRLRHIANILVIGQVYAYPAYPVFSGQTLWVTSWYRRASGDGSSAETGHRWKSYENWATFAHCQSSMFHAHEDIEGADVFVSRISHVFSIFCAKWDRKARDMRHARVWRPCSVCAVGSVGSQLTSMIQPSIPIPPNWTSRFGP